MSMTRRNTSETCNTSETVDDSHKRPPEALRRSRAQDSAEKSAKVRHVLYAMATAGERITFAEVRRRAGVSHAFVYSTGVRETIEEARRDPDRAKRFAMTSRQQIEPAAMLLRLQDIGVEAEHLYVEQREAVDRLDAITTRLAELLAESRRLEVKVFSGEVTVFVDE